MAWSKCSTCGETFNSVSIFDDHRVGDYEQRNKKGKLLKLSTRRCLTIPEMREKGMVQREEPTKKGWWWYGPMSDEERQRMVASHSKRSDGDDPGE